MNTLFFRLLKHEDKAAGLSEALEAVRQGQTHNTVAYAVDPTSFRQVPGSPFAYWVSERIRQLFTELQPFESEGRDVRVGDHPGDGFRYLRLFWEISTTSREHNWRPYQKGGEFSPYYFDIHLVADWDENRQTYRGFYGRPGRANARPSNYQYFFRPGLTWPRRTQKGLAFRELPVGCVFADKGPTVFVERDDPDELLILLAIANNSFFRKLVSLQMTFGSYEVGVIQRTPIPDLTPETTRRLATLARCAWSLKRSLDTASETSHAFILPALLQVKGESLAARILAWTERVQQSQAEMTCIQAEIDEHVFSLYGIYGADRENTLDTLYSSDTIGAETDDDAEDNERMRQIDPIELLVQLLSYEVGLVFKRFNDDLALERQPLPPQPEPFSPLPISSPGMLVQADGLHPVTQDVSGNYPLRVSWPGILVGDEGHPEDLSSRVRQVFEVLWPERASEIEHETCDLLGVRSLREYFTRPNNFFAEHLKRYSKSRRQAPIYWPLQTPSGSYTVWLYYPRLTDQTLYTCVNDVVEPKLTQLTEQLNALRIKTNRSNQEEKERERLLDFEQELKDFRDELLRVATFWKPNLNDGVQITAAPLWKLFQHKAWQKKLKDTWTKLEKGDYDWAHLAYSIWPDRVREKCKHDQSLAMAHGLDELYETPPEPRRKKRGRKQREDRHQARV